MPNTAPTGTTTNSSHTCGATAQTTGTARHTTACKTEVPTISRRLSNRSTTAPPNAPATM